MKDRLTRREFIRNTSLAGASLALRTPAEADAAAAMAAEDSATALWSSFLKPPDDARIMMRWWWFGPAVTEDELERELRAMKAAGIGGAEVQPVYPLALDTPSAGIRNLPFLSDDFIAALRFANLKARELGLRLDLTLGSGWPYGGSGVLATQAAGMLRVERVPLTAGQHSVAAPALEAGEALISAWEVPSGARDFLNARPISGGLDERITAGNLSGEHDVIFFAAGRTGMQVKRAAVGAEGFVLDHYDRAALDSYLRSTGDRLLQAFGSAPPFAVFCDSLEVNGSNWTPNLLAEFERRRGYDLKPHLPALAGDAGPKTAAIRCDWGRTLTELADENFLDPLREWADRKGSKLRAQVYGTPPVTLSSCRRVDLIEGEGADWRGLSPARWAASASHLYGREITSAETWTWIHSPVFRATPLDLKAEADRFFLQGINQIVGHGWPYSPPAAAEPGWRFYAAGALNAHNPWWMVMPELALYLQRVSILLRQGRPANDVAVYLSNGDAWATFAAGGSPSVNQTLERRLGSAVFASILGAGFNFDFIDDEAIERVGIPYSAVVLPDVERISLAAYQKLQGFVRSGGPLAATRRKPGLAPGLLDEERDGDRIRAITRELFDAPGAPGLFAEDASRLGAILVSRLTADVAFSPPAPDIGFIHRKLEARQLYFVANTGNSARTVEATFRVKNLAPERWDPFSGEKVPVQWRTAPDGRSVVSLELAPYESAVLVFSPPGATAQANNRDAARASSEIDLSRDWKLSFPSLGKTMHMATLHSWTNDKSLRFFSGKGIYEIGFSVPPAMLGEGARVFLIFGKGVSLEMQARAHGTRAWLDSPVCEAAVIFINGERAGSVWRPPYELEVARWLRPGANWLRIEVGNLAINEMAGKPLPSYRLLDDRYGKRATPQDMENLAPLPSGLLGPIKLMSR